MSCNAAERVLFSGSFGTWFARFAKRDRGRRGQKYAGSEQEHEGREERAKQCIARTLSERERQEAASDFASSQLEGFKDTRGHGNAVS